MSILRQEVVDIMKSWKNMNESDGSFKPIIDLYNSISPLPSNYRLKYTDDWGPATISAAFQQAGLANIFPCECSCARMIARAKEMDIWEEYDGYWPKIGEACLLDIDEHEEFMDNLGTPDYAGLVVSADKASKTFVIMIGNEDRKVQQKTFSVNSKFIRGFICPIFEDDVVQPKKVKTITTLSAEANDVPQTIKEPERVGTGTLSKIAAGSLVRLIDTPIYASPKAIANSGTKTGPYFIWSVDTVNGRVRITNSKDHVGIKGQVTGWIDANTAIALTAQRPASTLTANTPTYQKNAVYVVQIADLQVRKGPGTNFDPCEYKDLTPNAKKYDKNKTGCLCRGAKVTCLDVKVTGINVWIQIPSGWVQAYYNKKYYVK